MRRVLIWTLLCVGIRGFTQVETYSIGKTHIISSDLLNEDRKIAIFTPSGYDNSDQKYPVLYLLDGEWNFTFVSALVDKLGSSGDIPEMIVVGLINNNRSKDLTPAGTNDNKARFGGADLFLSFIKDELRPWVEEKYRTQPHNILAGHSFGGLFTIYAMLQAPEHFNSFIVLSPSLGRNDQQQVKAAEVFFKANEIFSKSLYLAIGHEGGHTQTSSTSFSNMVREEQPQKMRFRFDSLHDENHVSITTTGFINGLKFIFDRYNAESLPELDDIFLIESHYGMLSDRLGYEVAVPEHFFQKFVHEQIGEREYDYALFILDKYQKSYPNSAHLLSQYATVHLLKGDFKKAKTFYSQLKHLGIEDESVDAILEQLSDH